MNRTEKSTLAKDVGTFLTWLRGKLKSSSLRKYDFIEFSEPDSSDWFMSVPNNFEKPVRFNTFALNKCSFEYYRMIVIHECFHLLVQDIPNKIDAKRLKDDFGDTFMVFLDVEADFYTYMYLEEFHSNSLVDIFKLNYEGGKVFGDTDVRFPKFERFISASITIVNHFLKGSLNEKEIFLISIKNIPTENKIHALISKSSHFEAISFDIRTEVFDIFFKCYRRKVANKYEYISNIILSCAEILDLQVPTKIKNELDILKNNGI